ncbi:MAG: hypothetical protein ACU0DK_15595 [Pseudooceanicola sp.]
MIPRPSAATLVPLIAAALLLGLAFSARAASEEEVPAMPEPGVDDHAVTCTPAAGHAVRAVDGIRDGKFEGTVVAAIFVHDRITPHGT